MSIFWCIKQSLCAIKFMSSTKEDRLLLRFHFSFIGELKESTFFFRRLPFFVSPLSAFFFLICYELKRKTNIDRKESYQLQAVKLSATFRKASSDCSQKNARKTTTKRKLTDLPFSPDSSYKVPCLKQRKNSQNDVKITKVNKVQDNSNVTGTVNAQVVHSQMDKEFSKIGLDGEFFHI